MADSDRTRWNARYQAGEYADRTHPSALLNAWIDRLPRGRALDVACGAGRNALFLAERGFAVDAVDISGAALDRGRATARQAGLDIHWIEHDLDQPLALEEHYALILVIRYLNLPLVRSLAGQLEPGGFLLCEVHLATDQPVAGPANPQYRVQPGELRAAAEGLEIQCYDEGIILDPDQRLVALARMVAQAPAA